MVASRARRNSGRVESSGDRRGPQPEASCRTRRTRNGHHSDGTRDLRPAQTEFGDLRAWPEESWRKESRRYCEPDGRLCGDGNKIDRCESADASKLEAILAASFF